jgi:hypothetical protein
MEGIYGIEARWIVAVIAMLLVSGLMYSGTVPTEWGTSVIVAILGGLGLYERRARKQVQRGGDG